MIPHSKQLRTPCYLLHLGSANYLFALGGMPHLAIMERICAIDACTEVRAKVTIPLWIRFSRITFLVHSLNCLHRLTCAGWLDHCTFENRNQAITIGL